ncbi:MAG: stage sporulation protein [Clostridia bacterium]|jgi:stage II sporulation protein D|nr:stage sporulation protein [Clostridia bacterium]MDN5323894.1 stage sporulation protein [Clostridia bacterium]
MLVVLPSNAASIPIALDEIRVALNTELNSAEFAIEEGNYELVDYLTQLNFGDSSKNTIWRVTPVGKGSLQLSRNGNPLSKLAGPLVILRPKDPTQLNLFRFQGKRYRDTLLIENTNGKLNVINLISVEKYLYGVVGAEIGASAPDEALKAQAVVSRTYALYYKEHPQMGYDVGISTRWQVYGGYDMEVISGSRVKNAVDSTRGQVIYYDGRIIQAFFHANSGGFTENSENVWWAYIPYIRAVPAPEDIYALNYPVQEGGWPANTYQWTKSFTLDELNKQIEIYNRDYPDNPLNVGKIMDMKASRLCVDPNSSPRQYLNINTPSTRVTELEIIGTKGSKTFYRDAIRRVFDLRSSMFNVFFDSTVHIFSSIGQKTFNSTQGVWAIGANGMLEELNGSSSIYFVQDVDGIKPMPKEFANVIFSGKGYGHGLGMSQWGARGLAVQGYNYQQIIKHYYNNNNFDGKLTIGLYTGQTK